VKFIAETTQTGGREAVLELTEMPGYKTAWHRHNNCEESFYVIEGTLTIRLRDQISDLPTGS
jgi:mannose-6-phosphate isomerase-like protein (cupin superfamily)